MALSLKQNENYKFEPTTKLKNTPGRENSKSKSKFKCGTNVPSRINTKSLQKCGALFGDIPMSDTALKPKSDRKSVEESVPFTSPKSSSYYKLSSVNGSHPPLIRSFNPGISNATGKSGLGNGTKLPKTPHNPKGVARTPRNTPLDVDGGSKSTSAIKRSNGVKFRVSMEENSHPKCTPVSTSISINLASSPRKSLGSATRNARSSLCRSSSVRKSASQNLHSKINSVSSLNTTPSTSNQRISCQGTWSTPTIQSDLNSIRKFGVHTSSWNFYDLEQKDEESSTVSVGVRVRPIISRELKNPNIRNIISIEDNEVVVHCENGNVNSFTYDQCFWSCDPFHANYASQERVYTSMAKPLLVHAYEGYNVCLFAYGQTGSGKSYCIMGEDNYAEFEEVEEGEATNMPRNSGIIPRFCQELFTEAEIIHRRNADEDVNCKVVIEISYIEIYNEKIYDLVGWQNPPTTEDEEQRVAGTNIPGEKREPLKIREHPEHGPYVVGASCHLVTAYEDLETWIILGNKQRSIAATGMNDKSSRSHSIFSIKLRQTEIETIEGEEMEHSLGSVINIVDLAGSERVAASHSEGDRLKEGVCINKSLLTLGKVITALAESGGKRKAFVPYRESTLTWLLKESLGGNSKTTMIATISPCNIHQEETLSTLRYAQQARKIVNWNRINEDPTSKIIRALKLEVERLRSLQVSSPKVFSEGETKLEGKEAENGGSEDQESESDRERMEERREREREIIRAKEREINLLKENLRAVQEQFSERAKLWEDKLLEAESRKKEALERCRMRGLALKLEENEPTLVNLCEDPQLSQNLLYSLKKGSTTLGTFNADVTLSGLHETDIHCSILYEGDKLVLHPRKVTETYVNGKLVSTPTQVFHNDRIVLAGIYFFRVCFPTNSKKKCSGIKGLGNKFDFLFARDELLKEQEERVRQEMSIEQAATRAEMLRELEEQRLELQLQEMSMKESFKLLSMELEEERNLNQETEMALALLEEEKRHLEGQVKALNSLDSSEGSSHSPSSTRAHNFFKEMEDIFDESIQIMETNSPDFRAVNVEMWFMVTEANNICLKLKRPYKFVQQSRLSTRGFEIAILVHDLEHNLCASLDVDQLKSVLHILRDLASSEQDDDGLLDTAISWERQEEISKVPLIRNKIRESFKRLSMNPPLNTPSFSNTFNFSMNNASVAMRKMTPRRSSITPLSATLNRTATIAKAVSRVLLKYVSPSKQNSLFNDAISHLLQFHNRIKDFLSHLREPSSLSEEHLNEEILQIAMLTSAIDLSLTRLGSANFLETSEKSSDLQTKIGSSGLKIVRKVARMLQGVEKEVETLVEEESLSLVKSVHELAEEIGFLNLIVSFELPRGSSLISSYTVCQSYLLGVSGGMEWKVKSLSKFAETAADSIIASPTEDLSLTRPSSENLSKNALQAVTKTAAFLNQFSDLKVQPTIEETMTLKEAQGEANRFLGRVGAASENVQELISALAIISQEIRALDQGTIQIGALGEAIVRLQESLGDLVDDAGIGSSFQRRKESRSASISSDASVEFCMESLHTLAMKAFKQIKTLRIAVANCERMDRMKRDRESPSSVNFAFQEAYAHPLKSTLKSGAKSCDEKKVRFNVSLGSSMAGYLSEDDA